jgi:anti-sigma factor RsiW
MTVHEEWTDRLSDYLDGELSPDERGAVEAHLQSCAPCAAVLDDLKRVVARAQSVPARPPHADLWAGIAERIEAGRPAAAPGRVMPFAPRDARHFAFTLPQLAAAAALLIAVSGGLAWEVGSRIGRPEGLHYAGADRSRVRDDRSADPQVRPDAAAPQNGTGAADFARVEHVSLADAQYDAAVADLEQALKAGRGRLDASTIAVVEHNLQIIDQAIDQAREALVTDPANSYLSGHLVDARRRKLDLLRRATALASDTN